MSVKLEFSELIVTNTKLHHLSSLVSGCVNQYVVKLTQVSTPHTLKRFTLLATGI